METNGTNDGRGLVYSSMTSSFFLSALCGVAQNAIIYVFSYCESYRFSCHS
jgi:hypothetical protein